MPQTAAPHQPLWIRLTALLCIALTAWLGVLQVVHRHGELLPAAPHQLMVSTDISHGDSEQTCPLCAVMHSVLPSAFHQIWLFSHIERHEADAPSPAQLRFWQFGLFGRPPPARV